MSKVHFLIALHDHQPVGNFDVVFERACDEAYQPFLDELLLHPKIRLTLHYSGSLLEWIEQHRPEMIDRLRQLVNAGQIEIMSGGYYEPILTMLPDRDKIGQIQTYTQHLQELFDTPVRGIWLTERVWEQYLTRPLVDAGIEYAILDDTHFKYAGLKEEQLNGYYITEDEGRLLRLFAGSERLRYVIPFGDPWETTEYLGKVASRGEDPLAIYADDGEKFGVWPETHEHVFTNGWLRRFFEEMEGNLDSVDFLTYSEAIDRFKPAGRIYLPDASYREMTEWALPAPALAEFEDTVEELERRELFDRVKIFMRGGFWRNFKVKYPESNAMYAKSMVVSRKVQQLADVDADAHAAARTELYRGQCNCAYWHGVFGGLYLPHLRHAVYEHLIEAEDIADETLGTGTLSAEEFDYDFDSLNEAYLTNAHLRAVIKPDYGGHVVGLDVRNRNANLLAGLSRRFEAYHRNITNPPQQKQEDGEVRSIHHIVASKEENLDKLLHYDWYRRESFVDHFFMGDVTLEQMMQCRFVERGEFVDKPYTCSIIKNASQARVALERTSNVWTGSVRHEVNVQKKFMMRKDSPELECEYIITASDPLEITFAVECNLAFPGKEPEFWHYRLKDGTNAGHLEGQYTFEAQDEIGVVDKLKNLDISLRYTMPAEIWLFPILTVSQSESGFEHTFQSSAIVARWQLKLQPGKPWKMKVGLAIGAAG